MYISQDLLKILVCPVTKKGLIYDRENQELISPAAQLAFPIVNGIPIMLVDEAKNVPEARLKKILDEHKESVETKTA